MLAAYFVFGCGKAATVAGTTGSASGGVSPASASGPSAMLTTQFPTDDHLVLTWSLIGYKNVRLDMAGQTMNVTVPSKQLKVKLDLKKDPSVNQVNVLLETQEGTTSNGSLGQNRINVGDIPKAADGKPMTIGSLMTPAVTKAVALTPGEQVTLAKGAGAFPNLTVEVGGS